MRRLGFLLVHPFVLVLAASLSGSLPQHIRISLQETRIEDFSPSGLALVFLVEIANSSSTTYYLSGYDYRFLVNEREYFRLQTALAKQIMIEPGKSKRVSFPVKVTFSRLYQVLPDLENADSAQGHWHGMLRFFDGRRERGKLPLVMSGEFPLFREPGVEILSLHVNDLTVGGADLSLRASVKNTNGFALVVERVSYRFYLGNTQIAEDGPQPGEKIVPRSEKVFTFRLLLNFFDVGKEVHSFLLRPSTLCRFSGELEVRTEWGKVNIPFDQRGRVPISRIP